MGLLLSKEEARRQEIDVLIEEAWKKLASIGQAAQVERAAGIPPLPGTSQALYAAGNNYTSQLYEERRAIRRREGVRCPVQVFANCSLCALMSAARFASHQHPTTNSPLPAPPCLPVAGFAAAAFEKGEGNVPPMPEPTKPLQWVPVPVAG